MRSALVVVVVLFGICFANLDVVPLNDGSGLLWVTWVDNYNTAHLARYCDSILEYERSYPSASPLTRALSGHRVNVSLSRDELGEAHLIYMPSQYKYRDSLFVFDPYNEMLLESKLDKEYFTGWWGYLVGDPYAGLLRYPTSSGYGILGALYRDVPDVLYWAILEFKPDSIGFLTLGNFLSLSGVLDRSHSRGSDEATYTTQFRLESPVVSSSGSPIMATLTRRSYFTGQSSYSIRAVRYLPDDVPPSLSKETVLYWSTYMEGVAPGILALGSCSEDVILIYLDRYQSLWYATLDGFVTEHPFPGDGPIPNSAAAMTSNPTDEGLLLAWRDNNNRIMCRHYQGEWNGYAHVVDEDAGNVEEGNLAVYSVEDGYWIVWLPQYSDFPEFRFIQRDIVTSISEEPRIEGSLLLDVSPNPFMDLLHVSLSNVPENCLLEVFDNTGRVVYQSDVDNPEIYWNSSGCPSGAYYVRASTSGAAYGKKVILLR